MSLADDEKMLQERQQGAEQAAVRLGLLPRTRHSSRLPVPMNLCQFAVHEERQRAQWVCDQLVAAKDRRGGELYFVTVARPEGTALQHQLKPDLIHQERDWVSRRLRNLGGFGHYRAIGFVDLAWNERSAISATSHWSVHAHIVVYVRFAEAYREGDVLHHVFNCESDNDRVIRPVVVKPIHDTPGVMDYCSRALLLRLPRQRRTYKAGSTQNTVDEYLTAALKLEHEALVANLGPRPFWILSGIRRYGEKLHPMKSTVAPRLHVKFLIKRRSAGGRAQDRDNRPPTAPSRPAASPRRPHDDKPAPHRSR